MNTDKTRTSTREANSLASLIRMDFTGGNGVNGERQKDGGRKICMGRHELHELARILYEFQKVCPFKSASPLALSFK